MMEAVPKSAAHTQVTRGLDQVVAIETPEQVVFSYTIAGIGSRAGAALIDHALLAGGILLLWLLYAFVLAPSLGLSRSLSDITRQTGGWLVAVIIMVQFVAQWGYYVLFEALWDGQTPGKRWLRLRVVQDGGYSVSFAASAARNIARVLDMQPVLTYAVGLVAVAVSKTGKRTGDQLAGTIVVRERIVAMAPALAPASDEAPSPPAQPAQPVSAAALTEDELELLQRFLARAPALDEARRTALAEQLAARLHEHLEGDGAPLYRLRVLHDRERSARAMGAGARGDTGAARERWALVAQNEAKWSRFAARLADAQRRGLRGMSGDEVAGFVADYRDIATDLARLTTAAKGREIDALFRLSRLVAGGHNLLYRQERVAARAMGRFLFVTVPAELRRSALPILAAALLFFGSGAIAWIGVLRQPPLAEELVGAGMIDRVEQDVARARQGDRRYIDVEDFTRPILSSQVISNNVQVAFFVFASGLTAGIFTVLILLMNGISIGAVLGLFASRGIGDVIGGFVIAHSVFELSAICIAAGAGFIIAGAILLPGARTRREALVIQGRRALRLLAGAAMLLLFAGLIEGLISPRPDLPTAFKIAVAVACALLLLVYVTLGRGASPDASREIMAYGPASSSERQAKAGGSAGTPVDARHSHTRRAMEMEHVAHRLEHCLAAMAVTASVAVGCADPGARSSEASMPQLSDITADVEAAVWAFHAADTARDAEAVLALLWPDFTMRVDGNHQDYGQIETASRDFMGSLEFFHTQWTDLRVVPLAPDVAVASFQFRDSILTAGGDLIRSRGPTTFVWERRSGVWRVRFADSDHYPIDP
jgi:uncharacterized membrane protein SpoIIM required for sporulation/ketosteroid isomerase-like protein